MMLDVGGCGCWWMLVHKDIGECGCWLMWIIIDFC